MTSWVLKPGSHGTPPDDVGLDEGSSRREGTGLWGWLWGRGDFPLRRGVMFISGGDYLEWLPPAKLSGMRVRCLYPKLMHQALRQLT